MNTLKHFVLWLNVPIEEVTNKKVLQYIEALLDRTLKPKTINCHLDSIRGFYEYLHNEEELPIPNPVKRGYALRLPRPLPRYLKDEEVHKLLHTVKKPRDRAMLYLMLRCGLRVEEVARLKLVNLDLKRKQILVQHGKGAKDRIVYISNDAYRALVAYLKQRRYERSKNVFLVEKGTYKGKPISVRGVQKRIEYYSRKVGLKVCCHQLRHTMATQMLNADAELVTIQDLLGHGNIKTTQRYCKLSNLKVQKDYYHAMERIMKQYSPPMNIDSWG